MPTYCLNCINDNGDIGPRKLILKNKVIRRASKCDKCIANKSRFLRNKPSKASTSPRPFFKSSRKNSENVDPKVTKKDNAIIKM